MPDIVIIGAGVGGISYAIALKRQLKLNDFAIYDKGSDVGGTWRDNVYPGAASDTFIHFYSLSTDLNPDWRSNFGSQPEMYAYWRKLARKYDLYRHISFNRLVISAEWNVKEQIYHIVTQDTMGVESTTTAKILISAIGILEVPRFPDISGISSFKGETFHSARWNTDIELGGKRIAVIGNGASAMQFVPLISEDPTVQVTQCCRTPNWLLPPLQSEYSWLWKWAFNYVPFAMWLHRFTLFLRMELLYFLVFHNSLSRGFMRMIFKKYISLTAPKEDLKNLIPDYALGCKRMLFDSNYLTALHRPNLSLNWDGIQSICEDGIITKKGTKLDADVIIFATGFVADCFPLSIKGSGGETIQEYYESQGGPKAYIGTTIPGFPNFFMICGPNTTTGHTSIILFEELQIDYILKFVKPILDGVVSTFEVTHEATDRYNEWIQSRLSRSVHTSCLSWYRTGGDGKISSIFPGPGTLFWWCLLKPRWGDYKITGARWNTLVRREKFRRVCEQAVYVMLVAAIIFFVTRGDMGWISIHRRLAHNASA